MQHAVSSAQRFAMSLILGKKRKTNTEARHFVNSRYLGQSRSVLGRRTGVSSHSGGFMPTHEDATVHTHSAVDKWSIWGKKAVCDLYPTTCNHPIYSTTGPLFRVNPTPHPVFPPVLSCPGRGRQHPKPRCPQPTTTAELPSGQLWPRLGAATPTAAPSSFTQKRHRKGVTAVCVVHISPGRHRHLPAGTLPPWARPALPLRREERVTKSIGINELYFTEALCNV